MVANIKTVAFQGVEPVPVEVQVHLAPGQNALTVVGLPDKSVAESRERVRAALSAVARRAAHRHGGLGKKSGPCLSGRLRA